MLFLLVLCLFQSILAADCFGRTHDPDADLDLKGIILSRKFIPEVHYVTTDDGYILGVYRIVNPSVRRNPLLGKRPVIIQHGFLSSGNDFVINSPGGDYDPNIIADLNSVIGHSSPANYSNNLGFALANLGYDVWLGNSRGSIYSRNHTVLDPNGDKKFWDFSTDELIKYDQPALIDYVLNATNKQDLAYIGHSQGTLIMFGLLATRPEYSEKVKPFIAMAPVASFKEVKGLSRIITTNPIIKAIIRRQNGELLPESKVVKKIGEYFCVSVTRKVCSSLIFQITGFNKAGMNTTRLPIYMSHAPGGSSWKNMKHYVQMVHDKRWQKFDYGKAGNLKRYGTSSPPRYHLENIKSRYIALITGLNDYIATPKNVDSIRSAISQSVPLLDDYTVPNDRWNHVDPMWGAQLGTLVTPKIVSLLELFEKQIIPERRVKDV